MDPPNGSQLTVENHSSRARLIRQLGIMKGIMVFNFQRDCGNEDKNTQSNSLIYCKNYKNSQVHFFFACFILQFKISKPFPLSVTVSAVPLQSRILTAAALAGAICPMRKETLTNLFSISSECFLPRTVFFFKKKKKTIVFYNGFYHYTKRLQTETMSLGLRANYSMCFVLQSWF